LIIINNKKNYDVTHGSILVGNINLYSRNKFHGKNLLIFVITLIIIINNETIRRI